MVRWKGQISPEVKAFIEEQIHGILCSPPIHQSPHAAVYRIDACPMLSDSSAFLKVFPRLPRTSALEMIKEWLRGTKADRTRRGNILLRRFGFLVPRILATGRMRHSRWGVCDFVLERGVPGVPLHVFMQSHFGARISGGREKKRFIQRLAEIVRGLHAAGAVHGDLHSSNILISGPPHSPCVYLIDTLRACKSRRGLAGGALQDLRQLNQVLMREISLSDRLAFLRAYQPHSPLAGMAFREVIGILVERSETRLGQKRRSLFEKWDPRKGTRSSAR